MIVAESSQQIFENEISKNPGFRGSKVIQDILGQAKSPLLGLNTKLKHVIAALLHAVTIRVNK